MESEEVKVTPCVEVNKVQKKPMDKISTYHSATHLSSSSNRLVKIITGTTFLEAKSGRIHKLLVVAQAVGLVGGA